MRACSLAAAFLAAFVPLAAGAEPLDLARYMPVAEVQRGMTGVGKTTLEGTDIVEFQVRVLAVLKNSAPKRDLIVVRCSGAGLEESGIVAGMSGSPVYIGGRLIGAVAYAFQWSKIPLAGVQPIEQMLEVTDQQPWAARRSPRLTAAPAADAAWAEAPAAAIAVPEAALAGPAAAIAVPVAALGLADLPAAPAGRDAFDLQPIQTPVMVSGFAPRALARLREGLAPWGLVPVMGGGFDPSRPVKAKLEPGAPLTVCLLRGDVEATGMGTITEVAGDRLYGFGHAMFGFGEADYPLMTGVGHVVVPSLMRSFRIGAPVAEIGRLAWDEQTAIFGRLTKDRAAMMPVSVQIAGPSKGAVRSYRYEVIRHPRMTPMLAGGAVGNSIVVQSDLPRDHTVSYRVSVKPEGRRQIVRENLAVSPDADGYVENQVRAMLVLLMDNPYGRVAVESVQVEAVVEPESRLAEIQEVRPLRTAVRPGMAVPVELRIRPWRAEPRWMRVDVPVPADYPDGTYRATLCGADEALRSEMRDAPARFRPENVESLLEVLALGERRDQLFIRLERPGQGLAIGRDELPNLPPTMRTVLSESARCQVSAVAQPRVTRRTVPYVLQGSGDVTITVDRHAPDP